MPDSASKLIIEISGNAKEFVQALEDVKSKAGSLENQLAATAAISGAAFAAFAAEIGFATEAFAKQEESVNKLNQTLQSQGIFSTDLSDQYVEQAEAISRVSGVSATAIINGQGFLQSMIGQKQISSQLTQGVVDLAARTGLDLTGAFKLVSEAVNGNTGRLKMYGLQIDSTADSNTRLKQITEQLSQQFSGAAASSAEGLNGQMRTLAISFEQLQEKIGAAFAPALSTAAKTLKQFLDYAADHQELTDFVIALTAGGAIAAGLATAVAGAGLAFLKLKEILEVSKVAMEAMGIATKGLVGATGIGLLVVIVSEIYLHWNSVWPAMQGVFTTFVSNIAGLASGVGKVLSGMFVLDPHLIEEGWNQIKATWEKGLQDYKTSVEANHKTVEAETAKHEQTQDSMLKAAADRRQAEKNRQDHDNINAMRAASALVLAEANQESKEMLALRKEEADTLAKIEQEKFQSIRPQLQKRLAEVRQLEDEQKAEDLKRKDQFNDEILKKDKQFQSMSAADQKAFLLKNQQALQASIDTQKSAQEKYTKQQLTDEINAHNRYLQQQIQYGTAVATIDEAMHSQVYEGTKTAFGQMADLQNSNNAALKEIGKAAAVANIGIKTAEAAMNIYEGFSTIPIIGPALGIAAAAAAIAYGAEQTSSVLAAADGGMITGGIPGKDSVPALLMQGELVAPEKNFDEVVNAVADQRNKKAGRGSASDAPGGVGVAQIVLSLKDDLIDFVEAKIVERQRLGISILGAKA